MLTLALYTLLDIVSFTIGSTVGLLLIVEKRRLAHLFFGGFLFLFTMSISQRIHETLLLEGLHGKLLFFPFFLTATFPLLLFAQKSLTRKFNLKNDWPYLLPLAVELLFCCVMLLMPNGLQAAVWGSSVFHLFFHGLILAFNAYIVALLARNKLPPSYETASYLYRRRVWGNKIVLCTGGAALILQFMYFSMLWIGAEKVPFVLSFTFSALHLFFIGSAAIAALRLPRVGQFNWVPSVYQESEEVEEGEENEEKEALRVIDRYMKKKKPYLNPEINLLAIATDLGMSQRSLSQLINNHSGNNISRFINAYRVTEALELLNDPEKNHLSVAGIGFEAGFNSKATFYAVFKEFTGTSPAEFRNICKRERTKV